MTDTQETNEFDEVKYLKNLLKISQETQEELSKRILKQQKTIGSLTDTIDELKAHCKAVDELIEKMKCCENCKYHSFWGDELKCNLPSYDEQFNCLDSRDKWELID